MTCDVGCDECIDSGSNRCITCASGYYLSHATTEVSYGTCFSKSGSNSFTIYV